MADANDKPQPRLCKGKLPEVRLIKVHQGRYSRTIRDPDHAAFDRCIEMPVPWINMRGLWLQQAGFEIDTPIKVRVMRGCLVLTTKTEDLDEWEGWNED